MFNFKVESSGGNHRREGVGLSKGEWEGGLWASCARGTRGLRRPSLDARSGRPNRPPSCEKKASKLGRIIWKDEGRLMRVVKDRGGAARCPSCSQSPHDETVVARCAQ